MEDPISWTTKTFDESSEGNPHRFEQDRPGYGM